MITVICGEDSSSSRNYYNDLLNSFKQKGVELLPIKANELDQITKGLSESSSLFSTEKVFVTENLNKLLSKRKNPSFLTYVESLADKKDLSIVSWEESVSGRFLKFPKSVKVKEFKLAVSVFKLLDSCYPGNLKGFIAQLHEVAMDNDEIFIFIMLTRHLRNILLVNLGEIPSKLQSWQVAKLKIQAKNWKTESLIDFYNGLYNIDVQLKTGSNPYSVLHSLDILAAYYL